MEKRALYLGIIRTAADLFAAGDASQAVAVLQIVADKYDGDVEMLHHCAIALRDGQQHATAIDYFRRALRLHPQFVYSELELAETLAQIGDHDGGIAMAFQAIATDPRYIRSYLIAARLLRNAERHRDALDLLRIAFQSEQNDPELNLRLAEVLGYHNFREESLAPLRLNATRSDSAEIDHVFYTRVLSDLGRFAEIASHCAWLITQHKQPLPAALALPRAHAVMAASVDPAPLLARAQTREASGRWLTTDALLARLYDAAWSGRSFSMVRLGDGEARFLIYADRLRRGHIDDQITAIADSIWYNWFDVPISNENPVDLARLHAAIDQAIIHADILGLPTADRLEHDKGHFGYLAALDNYVTNIRPEGWWTDASAPDGLHRRDPFLRGVLGGLPFIGTVSCHPELAPRLARLLAIPQHQSYVVPGEMRIPDENMRGAHLKHFPDRYHALLPELQVPYEGATFLVAAGLLGKVYADKIRTLGGVAIDIGAIVDGWMGMDTRHGAFGDASIWNLPTS